MGNAKQRRAPTLSRRRLNAACSAIALMLAGEDNEGGWPGDVTREDLQGALAALNARLERTKPWTKNKTQAATR